jgi:hypothetical protein
MTPMLTLLFAATTGVAVANPYYVQPLLALIGRNSVLVMAIFSHRRLHRSFR